jgi:hypothetical protein
MSTTSLTMTHNNNAIFTSGNEHANGNINNTVSQHVQKAEIFLKTIDLSIKEPIIVPKIVDFNFFPTTHPSIVIYFFFIF